MVRRSTNPAPYKSPLAILPGETIKDILDSRNMTQNELAIRMGRPYQEISYLINGKRTITLDTAKQLEYVLGIKANFWLNIERDYQETKARLEEEEHLKDHLQKIKYFPYPEMVRLNLVKPTKNLVERVQNLLSFFQVANFDALEKYIQNITGVSLYRKSNKFRLSPHRLAIWLRMGEIRAEGIELQKFNVQNLKNHLPDIRNLTLDDPQNFVPKLQDIGHKCGVAFLFIRELKSFPVWGLTRWIGNNPYIQVNLRNKTNDYLWFALFHEIGHVLLHKKGAFFIHLENMNNDELENEADYFANNTLIPESEYNKFKANPSLTENAIKIFASKIGIAPGIVVGRLQHDGVIRFNQLNRLKNTYKWISRN
jgi:HTH-type transcriptional regulator/antitoxin HigA